jgi:tRNA threonylcarbamoyladenosine biosynthesis protein TsaE
MLPTHAEILAIRTSDWADEAACAGAARALARRPALRRACVELEGPLGAGKTTFVRHLLRALGVRGRIKSPTYAVLEPYTLPPARAAGASEGATKLDAVAHLDFYRFDDAREWEDAGLRDVFAAPGLKLVEWPEKARALLPRPDLRLVIEPLDDERRRVSMQALTPLGVELLE